MAAKILLKHKGFPVSIVLDPKLFITNSNNFVAGVCLNLFLHRKIIRKHFSTFFLASFPIGIRLVSPVLMSKVEELKLVHVVSVCLLSLTVCLHCCSVRDISILFSLSCKNGKFGCLFIQTMRKKFKKNP